MSTVEYIDFDDDKTPAVDKNIDDTASESGKNTQEQDEDEEDTNWKERAREVFKEDFSDINPKLKWPKDD